MSKPMSDDQAKNVAQTFMADREIRPGSIWRHYKGGLYTVVANAVKEDTLEHLVIYHSNARGTTWARTYENWNEAIDQLDDGTEIPRFRPEPD